MPKFRSDQNPMFRNKFSEDIFIQKYRHDGCETWAELAKTLVDDVCQDHMTKDEKDQLKQYITNLAFIPGGRYLYYAGRKKKFFNNCYLLSALDDSREDWAELSRKAELCLSTGGGIGADYSIYRASGNLLHGTGGIASGPIPKMRMVNEIGRAIIQGGSRRSAIYASLNWKHGDVDQFLLAKDWHNTPVAGTDKTIADLKFADFNYNAPLDMTNISINYDNRWLFNYWETNDYGEIFLRNCRQALSTGEPGFSFNFFDKENETLRNACTEVTSRDDSDVCNLGSVNFAAIDSLSHLRAVIELATKFLICGLLRADLPYSKVYEVRSKNSRIGLGVMGLHEWLIKRNKRYEVDEELKNWFEIYRGISDSTAINFSRTLSLNVPVARRAIAPTGTIGILAGTTTGIEPLFATAYKRRYLKGTKWNYQFVVDSIAQDMVELYAVNPDNIENALSLSKDYERRIKFQADVQDYVDMAISSTINIPAFGTELNNVDTVSNFARVLARYAPRLRGFTVYPDGSRGGQPLVPVAYTEALSKIGETFEEVIAINDICDISGRGGSCGV